jgi:methyl-accepting chemotaxis protein
VEARGSRGAAVGAVVIGRKLGTFFELLAPHTSDKPERQQRASFVKGSAVLASALPKDEWAPFGAETAKGLENFKRERQQDQLVPVLEVAGKTYDFASATVPGYDGAQSPDAPVGQIFLVRSRRAESDALRNKGMELGAWFAGAGVVAILVGWALALHITRPIDRYIAATQGLAEGQGDLTQRLEVHAQDELGRLATNLNRVFEKIHALAGRVQKAAFRVGDSSDKLSGVARAMLDGAKAQAIKIENSTAAVTELSASIQQVAENAGEATKVAQKSGSAAENAIQRLGQIRRAVEDAAARIEALGESGKRIGSIVEVIRHISEQTTLLALNAAIEAAHAGEQGRGFAVVADEVSNLAKRVGRSAKDIEDLIATIRDQTSEAVRAMQVGTREVEEGTQLVVSTLADLKTLIGVVEDTATAVNEQAIASDEIARNMDAVRTIAREVLGASEQAATEGDQLTRLAVVLEESVKGFKIDASKIQDVDGGSLPPSASSVPSRQLPARRPGN